MALKQFSSQLGTNQVGGAQLGQVPPVSTFVGSATVTGQGVLYAPTLLTTLLGQGVLTSQPFFVLTINLTGTGVFGLPSNCNRDMVLQSIQMPRSSIAVTMPIAYVTQINMPNDVPGCSNVTTTLPATGAFDALVPIGDDPENN